VAADARDGNAFVRFPDDLSGRARQYFGNRPARDLERLGAPLPVRAKELCGGGLGELMPGGRAQQATHQLGKHEPEGSLPFGMFPPPGDQLVDGVEGLVGDAGEFKELIPMLGELFENPLMGRIAVAGRFFQKPSFPVQKAMVHAPAVHPDRRIG
jgi:hypothetical protein